MMTLKLKGKKFLIILFCTLALIWMGVLLLYLKPMLSQDQGVKVHPHGFCFKTNEGCTVALQGIDGFLYCSSGTVGNFKSLQLESPEFSNEKSWKYFDQDKKLISSLKELKLADKEEGKFEYFIGLDPEHINYSVTVTHNQKIQVFPLQLIDCVPSDKDSKE